MRRFSHHADEKAQRTGADQPAGDVPAQGEPDAAEERAAGAERGERAGGGAGGSAAVDKPAGKRPAHGSGDSARISEAEAERRAIDFFDGLHADLPPEAEFANLIRSIVAQLRRRKDEQAARRRRHED